MSNGDALYIFGAGGFGRETLDALIACGRTISSFIDDERAGTIVRGVPVVDRGGIGGSYVVAIADPSTRERIAADLEAIGLEPADPIVHPRAVVSPDTTIGVGSVVLANVMVSSSVHVGNHVHINYNATVGHDARLEDFVTVLPGANIGGAVEAAPLVMIGSNACVLQGRQLALGSTIGAGAVVTKDVVPGAVVFGVPARSSDPS
jgi:sugar O-acyltransferase (sialic acid O-acetyltransferase NeuD family)